MREFGKRFGAVALVTVLVATGAPAVGPAPALGEEMLEAATLDAPTDAQGTTDGADPGDTAGSGGDEDRSAADGEGGSGSEGSEPGNTDQPSTGDESGSGSEGSEPGNTDQPSTGDDTAQPDADDTNRPSDGPGGTAEPTPGAATPEPADPEPADPEPAPKPAAITYRLPVRLTLSGAPMEAGLFSATLSRDGSEPLGATNGADGQVGFPALTFDAAGTHRLSLAVRSAVGTAYQGPAAAVAVEVEVVERDGALMVARVTQDGRVVPEVVVACTYTLPGRWVKNGRGWWFRNADGTWPANGWRKLSGRWYAFDGSGYMRSGWQRLGGLWYYLGGPDDGAMKSGWQRVGGRWYLLGGPDDGAMRVGWAQVDGKWYWLRRAGSPSGPEGSMGCGWLNDGGRWYYLTGSGAMATGWTKVGGRHYWLRPAGSTAGPEGSMGTGWLQQGDAWYWMDASGARAENRWQRLSGRWYWFDGSGAMAVGWRAVGGRWYWMDTSGAMAANRWIEGTYWVGPSGAMATNSWVDGERYWVDGSGRWVPNQPAKTGWQNPAGYWQVSSKTVRLPLSSAVMARYYVTPSHIMPNATRQQCIDAFVQRAREYLGTPYRWNWSHSPGTGVDCIGLVYQCAYATGMDMGEFNPYNHWTTGPNGWHSHDANNVWNYGKIQRLSLGSRQRGDLVFWPGHVAVYIGNDTIIEAWPGSGVRMASLWAHGAPRGVGRLYV